LPDVPVSDGRGSHGLFADVLPERQARAYTPEDRRRQAGNRLPAQLTSSSATSRRGQPDAGAASPVPGVTSHVAGDKLCCVHEAESADAVRCHAREGGFAANRRTEVATTIGSDAAKG
jgi:hypothetical protein